MQRHKNHLIIVIMCMGMLSACNVLPQAPTPTPTRRFTAPTLAPTAAIAIQNSEEIYGETLTDGQSNATAAALPVDAPLPPLESGSLSESGSQIVQIVLNEQTTLLGDLYQRGSTDNRVPGILILAEDAAAWGSLPSQLLDAGYTVLLVTLPPNFFAEELETLLRSLSENGGVDPARMAVIGAEATADAALLGCAIFEICDAVVMLSPQSRGALLNVLPNYNPRPAFIATSFDDPDSYATASSIATSVAAGSQFIEQATGTGASLLTLNGNLSVQIINWLNTVLRS